MAKRKIEVELGFKVQSQQAKQALQELNNSINQIGSGVNLDLSKGLTEDIQQGIKAAHTLQAALQKATNVDTGKIDLAKFSQSISRAGMSIKDLRISMQGLGSAGAKTFEQFATAIQYAEVPIFRISNGLKKLGTTLANTFRWQLSSTFLNAITSGIQEAITYAQDLNESLNNIRIVTGYSADKMSEFAVEANKAAKALSATTNEYAKASLIYFQQGLSDAEVVKRTETTLKLAKVTGETAETTSEWMTAIWNNFDNGSKSLEYYADVMTKLGAATASSSDEIAGGLEKFAAISKTIGLSYEYAAAALATVTATTRQSEDVVGTAFKTIFGRMEGLTLGQTLDDGTSLNKYSSALASVGVNIKDASGELKDMDTILSELGNKWDNLGRSQKVALAQVVGGMRQYNQLIALMDSWDFFEQNLELAKGATGELDAQFGIYEESWAAASDRVKASAESIYNELLNDEALIAMTDGLSTFLDTVNTVIDSLGGLRGVLLLLGSIVTQVFSKEIVAGMSSFGLSLMTMTKAGRDFYEKNKQKALDELGQIPHGGSEEEKAKFAAMEENAGLRKKLNKHSETITQDAREIIELQMEDLKILQEKRAELAKIREERELEAQQLKVIANENKKAKKAAEKEVSENKKSAYNAIGDSFKTIDAAQGISPENAAKASQAIQNYKKTLFDATSTTEDYKLALKEVKQALTDAGYSADVQDKVIRNLKTSTHDLASATSKLKAAEEAETNSTKAAKEADKEAIRAQQEHAESSKHVAEGVQVVQQAITTASLRVASFSEVMLGFARTAMQISMTVTTLQSSITNLFDENLSPAEKMTALFSALTMTIGTLVTLTRTFTSELGKNTIAAILNGTVRAKKNDANIAELQKKIDDVRGQFNSGDVFANGQHYKKRILKKSKKEVWDVIGDDGKIAKRNVGDKVVSEAVDKEIAPLANKQNMLKDSAAKGKGMVKGGLYAALAIAAATVTIAAFDYAINRFDKEAKKAEKAAENLNQQFQTTKQNFESLKQSMASYKDARKGIDELTRGTKEYNEAIRTANDQAMELIKNNSDLKWSYNSEGVIEIDEESMEQLEQDKEAQMKQQQAAALRAQATATEKRNKANDVEFARQKMGQGQRVGSGAAGLAGGGLGGAATGAAAGAAIGSIVPGIGTALGALVGVIAGGIIGTVAGGVAGAATGMATEHEQEGLDKLREEYERLSEEGRESELKTKQGIIDALGPEFADLADALTQNVDATYELISSQAELLNQQRLARLSSVDAILADSEEYNDSKYKGIMNQQMVNAIYNDPDYQSKLEEEIEKVNDDYRSFWNTDEALAEAWAKEVLNVESDNIEFSELAGDEFKYRIKNADGTWGELQTAYKEDIAKQIAEQRLLEQGATDEKIKEFQEENQRRESALLAEADIYDEDKRLALMMQAAENAVEGDNTQYLKDLSDYTLKEIEAIEKAGFDVTKAIENRDKELAETNEKLANRGTSLESLFGVDNMADISEDAAKAAEKVQGKIFNSIGLSGNTYLSQLIQGQEAEDQVKMLEALSSYDWQSVDDPVATLLHMFDEMDIAINEQAVGALTNLANSMDEAADASMLLGTGFENMCKKITEALKTVKGLTSGSVLDAETYKNLIKTYPSLEKFFDKTAEGYKSFVSQEELEKHVRNSLEKNTITAIKATRKLYNYWDANTEEGKARVEATSSDIKTLTEYKSEDEQTFNTEFEKFINSLPTEVLQAMGTNADSLNNQKFDEKQTWLASLMSMTNVEGLDKNIRDATTTLIDNQKFTSREEAERYLRAVDKELSEEQISDYLDRWDAEFGKNAFNEFFDEIENGLRMKHLSKESKDLEKALNKLKGSAWSAAKELQIRGAQLNNLQKQIDLTLTEMPALKTAEEIAALNEDYRKQYWADLEKTTSTLEGFEEQLNSLNQSIPKIMTSIFDKAAEAFDKIDKKIDYAKNVASSYKTIAELGGQFTGTDQKLLDSITKTSFEATLTGVSNAKNRYNSYLESKNIILENLEKAKLTTALTDDTYWQEELDKINDMVDSAHQDFLASWASAMEEAKQIYEENIGKIFDDYKRSFSELRDSYEREKELTDFYAKDYEKAYRLTTLNQELAAKLDETDSLSAKQKLLAIQQKINNYQKSGNQMTQYELDMLQKEYELELAKIALEDAQRKKTQVQLTRKADGSWGYVYTADQSKVADAEQTITDKIYEMQKLTDDYTTTLNDKALALKENWLDAVEAIWMDTSLSEAEKEAKIKEVSEHYRKLAEGILGEFKDLGISSPIQQDLSAFVAAELNPEGTGIGSLLAKLKEAFDAYEQDTGKVLGAAGSDFDKYLGDIKKGISNPGQEPKGITELLKELDEQSDETWKHMKEDISQFVKDVEPFMSDVQGYLTTLQEMLEAIKQARQEMLFEDTKTRYINSALATIQQWELELESGKYDKNSDEYLQAKNSIEGARQAIDKMDTATSQKELDAWYNAIVDSSDSYNSDFNEFIGQAPAASNNAPAQVSPVSPQYPNGLTVESIVEDKNKHSLALLNNGLYYNAPGLAAHEGKLGGLSVGDSLDIANTGEVESYLANSFLETSAELMTRQETPYKIQVPYNYSDVAFLNGHKLVKDPDPNVNLYYDLNEVDEIEDTGAGFEYTWNFGSMKYTGQFIEKGYTEQFNTGGYTGSWGPEGRWAMLHQKEIVLNAHDTENFLAAINILRQLVDTIDLRAVERSFGETLFKQLSTNNINSTSSTVAQDVKIYAEFPNATNHSEIEEAFNNLVNSASQYANRK